MTKKANVEARLGLGRLNDEAEVTVEEIEELGYEYKETKNKEYAVGTTEAELPENVEEALDMLGEEDVVDIVQSRIKSRESKKLYDEIFNSLNKEVPAAVKDLLGSMYEMSKAGLAPYSEEDLDSIPFEAKTSKDKLMGYVSRNLK